MNFALNENYQNKILRYAEFISILKLLFLQKYHKEIFLTVSLGHIFTNHIALALFLLRCTPEIFSNSSKKV